tara:strand:- start:214 stop:432 length:219 start_codon:yes stop_codon:yes gene_type:complete
LRKEKNTIKLKRIKKKNKRKQMIKKIFLVFTTIVLTSCTTVKEKSGNLMPNIGECPPQEERTLSDIICKEAK